MKRVSKACQQCRSKHIKCNGRSPCSRCIAHAELHNISPSDICLYPEPKKRGRPSTGTSSHQHHTTTSPSVVKKKANTVTNRGRITSSHSPTLSTTRSNGCSANSSPVTNNFVNLQQHTPKPWAKSSIDPPVYWNGQIPYILPQQVPYSQMAEFFLNLTPNYTDGFGYFAQQQQQPQPRMFTLNANTSPSLTNPMTSPNLNPSSQNCNVVSNASSNNNYRHSYGNNNNNNNNSNGGRTYSNNSTNAPQIINNSNSTTSPNNNSNNKNNTSNNDNTSTHSHHYHLNKPYYINHRNNDNSTVTQVDANSNSTGYSDCLNNNNNNNNNSSNLNNEGNISDSSDSPYSSLTSTPEMLPTFNANIPSVASSPLLSPSEFYPYWYGINAGNGLNIGHTADPLLHNYILPSYHQESDFDSPLLSANESETAYSVAPYTINNPNCIYPCLLERNCSTTPHVKTEDSRLPYDQIPVNINWPY